MTDLSIIRERHQPDRPDGFQSCKTCIHFEPHEYDPTPDEWPCDVRIVLDALDGAAAAERERLYAAILGEHDKHECSPGFCTDLIVDAAETELEAPSDPALDIIDE